MSELLVGIIVLVAFFLGLVVGVYYIDQINQEEG